MTIGQTIEQLTKLANLHGYDTPCTAFHRLSDKTYRTEGASYDEEIKDVFIEIF